MAPIIDVPSEWSWPEDVRARFDALGKPAEPKAPEAPKPASEEDDPAVEQYLWGDCGL